MAKKSFEENMARLGEIVEKLEKEGKGLNLTWEVRDGILNHQISLMPSTLEGKIVVRLMKGPDGAPIENEFVSEE